MELKNIKFVIAEDALIELNKIKSISDKDNYIFWELLFHNKNLYMFDLINLQFFYDNLKIIREKLKDDYCYFKTYKLLSQYKNKPIDNVLLKNNRERVFNILNNNIEKFDNNPSYFILMSQIIDKNIYIITTHNKIFNPDSSEAFLLGINFIKFTKELFNL
jgi:hypothetical protein